MHGGAHTRSAGERERTLVFLHEAATDGQPSPGAFAVRFRDNKRLQHPRQSLRRNATANIGKGEHDRGHLQLQQALGYAESEGPAWRRSRS